MKSSKRDMTRGPEWKVLLLFALPIMAGQLLQQLYNTVDGIVVGNFVSSQALAAVGTCSTLANLFIYFSNGLSNGCGVVVAQFFGAGRREEMRRAVTTAMISLILLGTVLGLLACIFTPWIMKSVLRVSDPTILTMSITYFRIYALGIGLQFAYNIVASIMRAVGDSRSTLYFLLVSTVGNALLDVMFVAGFGMDVDGVAIATVLAQLVCIIVCFVYMSKKHPDLRFGIGDLKLDKNMLRLCVKMAVPSSLQQLVVASGNLMLQRLVNTFGPVTMSAYTVGGRLDMYLSVPTMGMFNALSNFTGQNTGAGKPDRVKRGFRASLSISVSAAVLMSIGIYAFAPYMARIFGVEGAELAQSVEYMRFFCSFFFVFALYIPFNALFQGSGVPLAAAAGAIINLSTRVFSSYAMAYFFDVGYSSVWKSNVIGWGSALIFALCFYKSGKWRNKSLVKEIPAEKE